MIPELATLIREAACPGCGHLVLECHDGQQCLWRPASESPAARRLQESTPLSVAALLGPQCDCTLSDAEALSALLHRVAADWAGEKFTRMCNDPEWAGQAPSMGFQATYSQYLVEDR
jgi:hypothetical protein